MYCECEMHTSFWRLSILKKESKYHINNLHMDDLWKGWYMWYTVKYIYMWYSVLNKMLLKLISPISFPSFEVDTKKF